MSISSRSRNSRGTARGATAVFLPLAAVAVSVGIAVGGCARHARTVPPPATDVAGAPPKPASPAPPVESGVQLPGQNRFLPSEDPRNLPAPGAREVPLEGGATPGPGAEIEGGGVAPASPVTPPATGSPGAAPPGEPAQVIPEGAPAGESRPGIPEAASPGQSGEGRYRVQIFALSSQASAFARRDEIATALRAEVGVDPEQGLWKVRVQGLRTRAEAEAMRRRVAALGYNDAFVLEVRGK